MRLHDAARASCCRVRPRRDAAGRGGLRWRRSAAAGRGSRARGPRPRTGAGRGTGLRARCEQPRWRRGSRVRRSRPASHHSRARPGGDAIARFERMNVNGVRTVLGVLAVRRDAACDPTWYRVQLPIRPNGAVGWVRAADVQTASRDDAHPRRPLRSSGHPVPRRAARCSRRRRPSGNPAPRRRPAGTTSTSACARPIRQARSGLPPSGSRRSRPTLQEWTQGGPIAIHGTNTPYKLGLAVSHGCVRIANVDLLRLYEQAEEGTPVLIRS